MSDLGSNISFVVPTFNSEKTVRQTINSIYNNNFRSGDEVIVVDDCSTDHTREVITELQKEFTALRVLGHRYNRGSASASRNTAIENARNELIFCIDSDNELESGSVSKLKHHMLSHKSDAAAFGGIHYFKDNRNNVELKWLLDPVISFITNINHANRTPCLSGNYLFTRQSWLLAGRCNESVGGAWDSWCFGAALLASGAKMITLPNTFYYHRWGYESTYIKHIKSTNVSLKVLQILLPYLHLIARDDIDYIMGPHKYDWFDHLDSRPLRPSENYKTYQEFVVALRENF